MAERKDAQGAGPEVTINRLDTAILELTTELLPNYADMVRKTDISELPGMMDAIVCEVLTVEQKGKNREKMLGSLLILMSAQQKRSDQLLQQALAGAETQKAKKKILKKQCEDMKESLTETQKVLAETKEILAETQESLIKANETLTETEEVLKETKESLDKANNRIDQVESQLRTQEDEYAKLQDECSDLKQVLNA